MFITFEGPEGAGKSTLLKKLRDHFVFEGHRVFLTREPGAGELGRLLRKVILFSEKIDPIAELFLFLADRANHVERIIKPALAQGKLILCDRYADSTIVYQGHARGFDIEKLREWNAIATRNVVPDRTFLLDIDPEIGLKRRKKKDRLDSEPLKFHQKVREGFLREANDDPGRWKIVDASQKIDEVFDQVYQEIRGLIR